MSKTASVPNPSMLEGTVAGNPSKRSAPPLADGAGSAKKLKADAGLPALQNRADNATTGEGLRILVKPASASMARVSSKSSSALSTPEDTPDPTSAPFRRLKPIRFHTTSARGSASKASKGTQDSSQPTLQSLAASGLNVEMIGPYSPITGHFFELQDGRCSKKEYRLAQKCFHCTGKNSKQSRIDCSFHGSRVFVVRKAPFNTIDEHTPSFLCTFKLEVPTWNLRTRFHQTSNVERDEIMKAVANGLHATLVKAERHASMPNAILRNKRRNERRTCVYCMAPFFTSYWLCGECGRKCCDDCCQAIKECLPSEDNLYVATNPNEALKLAQVLEHHTQTTPESERSSGTVPSGTSLLSAADLRYEHDLSRLPPSETPINAKSDRLADFPLLACGYGRLHGTDSFLAVTTYDHSDLYCLVKEADRIVSTRHQPAHNALSQPEEVQGVHATVTLDEAIAWESQRPMLIARVGDKFEVDWRPESFSNAFAKVTCEMKDCSSLAKRDVVVTDFFYQYGNFSKRRDGTWKIEDWPKMSDLATWQPDVYTDFIEHLPLPEYTRPDGIRNLASMIPLNVKDVEMGPKLLCACKSLDQWNHGTVKLRTNAVDTLNVLAYASDYEDKPGEVIWTIWPPGSVNLVREHCYELLARQNSKPNKPSTVEKEKAAMDDPVYLRCLYLGPEARSELEKRGAKPWVIRQEAGQAVTVPAGCPYQVCNLSDCISINTDFLSPESVERCLGTLPEFQIQTRTQIWKEELLRLKSIAFYAFRSSSSNLPKLTSTPNLSETSRPKPSKHSVATAASVRPIKTHARRGRPPGSMPKLVEVVPAQSPTAYLSSNEQPPMSDMRSNSTATPAQSPSTMAQSMPALSRSTTPTAAHIRASSFSSSMLPHELTFDKLALDSAITTYTSTGDDSMQLDPDSPVISKRPLPKLRGRSPSEIEPVLKPSANSGVRTRPASSLPEDQEAFYGTRKARVSTTAADVSPPTASVPTAPPKALPASAVTLPEQATVVQAPATIARAQNSVPQAQTNLPQTQTVIPRASVQVIQSMPATQTIVPRAPAQMEPSLPQATKCATQIPAETDRSLLEGILLNTKQSLGTCQILTPDDERRLDMIVPEVFTYAQRSLNGLATIFNQNPQAYPPEIQNSLNATTSSFAKVTANTNHEDSSIYKATLADLSMSCKVASVDIFQYQKWSRVAQRRSKQDKEQAQRVTVPLSAQLGMVTPRDSHNSSVDQLLQHSAQRMPGPERVRSEEVAGRAQATFVNPVATQRLSIMPNASSPAAGRNDLNTPRVPSRGAATHPAGQRGLSPHAGSVMAHQHPSQNIPRMGGVAASQAIPQCIGVPNASSSRPVSPATPLQTAPGAVQPPSRSNNSRYPPSSYLYGEVPYTIELPSERRAVPDLRGQSLFSDYIARYG